jgi:ribosomal-protein-alanine N-acetyltransferase
VRPSNVPGRALYAGNGFAEVGVRRDYYPGRNGREDAIVLSLAI